MSQVNTYKVARDGSQFGKTGTDVPLTANQAAPFERTGEIVFHKAGETSAAKVSKADAALKARVRELETELEAAKASTPNGAAVKAAQDAQAEAERLLAAGKEAAALTEAELTKTQGELTEARADLQKAADDFALLQEAREADEAQLTELGFTRNDEGDLVAPPVADSAPEPAAT
ncbi:MAG: hypothetical protein Q8L84_08505 [Hyphomonas sp.]|nr:hypothetical protein [Hyphomonas sp.]